MNKNTFQNEKNHLSENLFHRTTILIHKSRFGLFQYYFDKGLNLLFFSNLSTHFSVFTAGIVPSYLIGQFPCNPVVLYRKLQSWWFFWRCIVSRMHVANTSHLENFMEFELVSQGQFPVCNLFTENTWEPYFSSM